MVSHPESMSMKITTFCFLFFLGHFLFAQVNDQVANSFMGDDHRQFDFWMGEWDVNLRIRQSDNTWDDAIKSTARIYRILDGKAILELWNENKFGEGIKGYSLRYFNVQKNKWELWLNWPSPNQSGTSSLEGVFRHGRGDFFAERSINDSTTMISRYSFNDITSHSLRWDDGYSTDGGKTWSGNWIMEFSRRSDLAPQFHHKLSTLTYDTGKRCNALEFKTFDKLVGDWTGEMLRPDGASIPDVKFSAHRILDGCAIIAFYEYFIDGELHKEFKFFTFNTYINKYEEHTLANTEAARLKMYYGTTTDGDVVLQYFDQENGKYQPVNSTWILGDDTVENVISISDGENWAEQSRVVLQKL